MTEAEILAAEEARCAAMIGRDLAALGRLLDEELVWIHSSARVEDKAAFIARIDAGEDAYLAIRRSDEKVRIHDRVAIVTGIADMDAIAGGVPRSLRNRFTNVWRWDEAGPRLLSCQSTKLQD